MTDTNDNSPAFTEAAYSLDIPEDTGRGAFVGAVSVTDLDEGVNAQVSYTVLSDWGNDVFSLNPQSGVFTLTSRLDYEQVSSAPSLSLSPHCIPAALSTSNIATRPFRVLTVVLSSS